MTRFAINMKQAVVMMLESGFSEEETVNHLNSLNQPTPGYVYADDIPIQPSIEAA